MRLVGIELIVQVWLGEVVSQGELRIHGRGTGAGGEVGIRGGGGQRMRQARRRLRAGGTYLRRLLRQLRALDDIFDDLLLLLPLVVVAPPHRPFVFALEPEVFARFALPLTFVALLSSQATCEASCSSQPLPLLSVLVSHTDLSAIFGAFWWSLWPPARPLPRTLLRPWLSVCQPGWTFVVF